MSLQLCDFAIAVPFTYGRRFVEGFGAREILLPYPAPARSDDHERFFAAPVRFSATALGLVFPAALLSAPLRTAHPRLANVLEGLAQEKVVAIVADVDPVAHVRGALHAALRAGHVSLADVARRVALSPRTLQRQLTASGTTFAAQLNRSRHEMALVLLTQPELGLHEVAFLLGFSEPAAFHRAFRRWTGEAPGSYRQRIRRG